MLIKPKNVIISVKPEFALKILSGEKTVELRRRFPVDQIEGGVAVIYASSPIKEIIGYVTIKKVEQLPTRVLWRNHGVSACVSKDFFFSYFEGANKGFALSLSNPKKLAEPLNIKRMEDEFMVTAPQSFRYAPDRVLDCIAA